MAQNLQLKDVFLFTQNSMKTFQNCPLKFKKRYVENLKWENIPDPNIREKFQRGIDFHLLAQRYFLDMPPKLLQTSDDTLQRWGESLVRHFPLDETAKYLPEHKLRLKRQGIRLEANYDLIVVKQGSIDVWDFKTSGESQNKKKDVNFYINSLQTKVYLYVVKELSSLLTEKDIAAPNIRMLYWQPEPPQLIGSIQYSEELHKEYEEELQHRIRTIEGYDFSEFQKEAFQTHCRSCEFNPFCNQKRMDAEAVMEEFSIDDLELDILEELF